MVFVNTACTSECSEEGWAGGDMNKGEGVHVTEKGGDIALLHQSSPESGGPMGHVEVRGAS